MRRSGGDLPPTKALFASIGGNDDMLALLDTLPDELVNAIGYDQITTGAGYTQSTFYGLIGFALLAIDGSRFMNLHSSLQHAADVVGLRARLLDLGNQS